METFNIQGNTFSFFFSPWSQCKYTKTWEERATFQPECVFSLPVCRFVSRHHCSCFQSEKRWRVCLPGRPCAKVTKPLGDYTHDSAVFQTWNSATRTLNGAEPPAECSSLALYQTLVVERELNWLLLPDGPPLCLGVSSLPLPLTAWSEWTSWTPAV